MSPSHPLSERLLVECSAVAANLLAQTDGAVVGAGDGLQQPLERRAPLEQRTLPEIVVAGAQQIEDDERRLAIGRGRFAAR